MSYRLRLVTGSIARSATRRYLSYSKADFDAMRQNPQKFYSCKNVLEVLYHHAKFAGAQISPAAGTAKNTEFFCPSVTLLKVRLCAPNFAIKALDYRNDFDTVG